MDRRSEIMRIGLLYCAAAIFIAAALSNLYAASDVEDLPADHVAAYYFHGDFRCANCRNIERFSREAIERNFKDELASGRLIFRVINTDQKANEHFVDHYQLYTRSLVLSLVKDGREAKSKNLTKVWEYLTNESGFHKYVEDEITLYLNELR